MDKTLVVTLHDGRQVMIRPGVGGNPPHVAERSEPWLSWSPPLALQDEAQATNVPSTIALRD